MTNETPTARLLMPCSVSRRCPPLARSSGPAPPRPRRRSGRSSRELIGRALGRARRRLGTFRRPGGDEAFSLAVSSEERDGGGHDGASWRMVLCACARLGERGLLRAHHCSRPRVLSGRVLR